MLTLLLLTILNLLLTILLYKKQRTNEKLLETLHHKQVLSHVTLRYLKTHIKELEKEIN